MKETKTLYLARDNIIDSNIFVSVHRFSPIHSRDEGEMKRWEIKNKDAVFLCYSGWEKFFDKIELGEQWKAKITIEWGTGEDLPSVIRKKKK